MERYRAYGQEDDQPLSVGDENFFGVDEYNDPENVRPGYVQNAVNTDFTTGNAKTRGGFVCLPELGSGPFGTSWGLETVSPSTITWNSVAYGSGIFVAVGVLATGYGAVMTSPDGVNWTIRSVASAPAFNDVAFGNGKFVAVGAPYGTATTGIRVSTDGITWTNPASNSTLTYNSSVAYGNGTWVVISASTGTNSIYSYTSTNDGVTWTQNLLATGNSGSNCNVVYGNGKFVVTLEYSIYIYYSSNGTSWSYSQLTDVDPIGLNANDAVFGSNKFVIINQNGSIYTSPNGINWARTRDRDVDGYTAPWYCMIGSDQGFIAAGGSSWGSLNSINASEWIRSSNVGSSTYYGGTFGNDLYVLVGGSGAVAYSRTPIISVFASSLYSDPTNPGNVWTMLLGCGEVGFYAFGHTSRLVSLGGNFVTEQSTILQANNYVYVFRGDNAKPLYWNGDWNGSFTVVPDTALPVTFNSIPNSNQATYYQNRLWVKNGKDSVAASDVLAFTDYDPLANEFNLNTGNSDYVVATFPFGQTSLVCFKNKSIQLMQQVDGALTDVIVTEITRQVGLVGINAVTSVGPDLAYVSYGNVNLLTLTSTNNAIQHKTLPLSAPIRKIMDRVNWNYSYKISLGYWNNRLYVALPLDGSMFCNHVVVYNFITESWFGDWSFNGTLNMCILGWQVLDYLGLQRLHCITEDGRIFVTDEGQNDISGTLVSEISTSLTTRAYNTANVDSQRGMLSNNHFQRRLYIDIATNRPKFSVSSYTEGVSEESELITDQTYTRSQSWKFSDSAYDLTNANNDYNRAYRRDYSTGPASVQCGTGFLPEAVQHARLPMITQRQGRLSWMKVTNTQGVLHIYGLGFEARAGQRSNTVQV